jgi:tetratricopeptide (TPR) repeat protein
MTEKESTMDLLDFDQAELYFDEPLTQDVARLLVAAADAYGSDEAESFLLRANLMAPQHLMVLVALYRYYFYQHRLEDALLVAESMLAVVGRRLEFPETWVYLREANVGEGVMRSMGMVRFYLMVLKATGYIHLRLGNVEAGKAVLEKLVELDSHDRIGGKALLDVLHQSMNNDVNLENRT